MSHTEGKLSYAHRENSRGMYSTEIFDETGKTVFTAAWYPVKTADGFVTNREDNARRLVACWNLCTGMDTELLETIIRCGDTLEARFSDFVKKVDERDEALEVLKLVGSDITTTLYKLNKETEARVNTILSKHKDKP